MPSTINFIVQSKYLLDVGASFSPIIIDGGNPIYFFYTIGNYVFDDSRTYTGKISNITTDGLAGLVFIGLTTDN